MCRSYYFTEYDAGPFDTTKDLETWLNNRQDVCKDFNRVPQDRPPFVVADLVMSHMDLHPHNIIMDTDGRPWLIDWGRAGGYLPRFEYANLLHTQDQRMVRKESGVV